LAAILFTATILACQSFWRAGFIWDDDVYVTQNPLLTAPDGLRRIWFSLDSPSQYFPLTYTTFYFERAIWNLHSVGYHWVNTVLHAVNALLLWRLLARLRVPGAWIAAAIFALHPVQVESVAWITERKNVLMGFFFFLTLLSWIEFIDATAAKRLRYYVAALIFFALTLTAKTTACTLPAALLLILSLKRISTTRQRIAQIIPFVALGALMGLVTLWWERFHQGTRGSLFALGPLERLLVACHAIWFYLGKFIWPANLTFSYPRWPISRNDPIAYFWLVLTVVAIVALWLTRRKTGRSLGIAALFFVATLLPVLGFIMLYTFRYTFVADHYQYLACIGPAALVGAGVAKACERWKHQNSFILAVTGIVILTLGVLTWRQGRIYMSDETLWRDTLAKNPGSWLACNNLGNDLLQQGETDQAITQFNHALELEPALAENYGNLGDALIQKGQPAEALTQYEKSIALNPNLPEVQYNYANALRQEGRVAEAIAHYRAALALKPSYAEAHSNLGYALYQTGDVAEAALQWRYAVELQPDNVGALNNLAWILATSPSEHFRNGKNAIALAEQASQLNGNNPVILRTLAAAYAEGGRFADAINTAQSALALAQGNSSLSNKLQAQMALYKNHLPYRDSPQ
jgi:tetratricopeptide (TPR) repeat protein